MPGELFSLFGIFIQNGLEASGSRLKIMIRVNIKDESGIIEFRDTGPGIKPEVRKMVFDPFFTTKGKNMGIGLTLAGSIAAAYDGRIEFSNEPDWFVVSLIFPVTEEKHLGYSLPEE